MTVSDVTPRATLREAQTEATRRRIVDGLLAVLAEEHPASLSMPAVARRAGVSLATVYRYFPTKEALLDAGSEIADQLYEQGGAPLGLGGLEEFLRRAATAFQGWAPLVQAQVASPVGREVRRRRLPRGLAAVRSGLQEEGIDTDTDHGERLVHLLATFLSSVAIIDLMERQGLTPDRVAADLTWATQRLVEATNAEQVSQEQPRSGTSPRRKGTT